jgi:hypothetical protein
MCAAVLALEAITVGLATPVMITVNDVGTALAVAVGVGMALLCLLLSGMLRAEWAYGAGWVLQVLAIAMGFLVPLMFFLGGLFGLLWGTAYLLGVKIEREKAAAYAAWDREQGAG